MLFVNPIFDWYDVKAHSMFYVIVARNGDERTFQKTNFLISYLKRTLWKGGNKYDWGLFSNEESREFFYWCIGCNVRNRKVDLLTYSNTFLSKSLKIYTCVLALREEEH